MKKKLVLWFICIVFFLGPAPSWASVQADIENANKTGKTVFLVVTEPGIDGTEKARDIARKAHELEPASSIIEMNRADTTNKPLVTEYRLAGAPLPVILVIATNGLVTGGSKLDYATPEGLTSAVPSPKKMEILQTLQAKKAVIVVAGRKSMPNLGTITETSQTACTQMKGEAALVAVDMDDTEEKTLLSQMQVSLESAEPVTRVINAQGRITAGMNGTVSADDLVKAATMKATGGCCPGGSKNSGCGPTR